MTVPRLTLMLLIVAFGAVGRLYTYAIACPLASRTT
jgi:hypothetical protein